jgi:hypothetical protein
VVFAAVGGPSRIDRIFFINGFGILLVSVMLCQPMLMPLGDGPVLFQLNRLWHGILRGGVHRSITRYLPFIVEKECARILVSWLTHFLVLQIYIASSTSLMNFYVSCAFSFSLPHRRRR